MPLRKTDKADLRKRYPIYVQIGMVATLLLLILAFRADLRQEGGLDFVMLEQEIVEIEEIEQTQHLEEPPPPPRPPVPIEVPDDQLLDDVELDLDAALDINEPLRDAPPPPPPAETRQREQEPEIFVIVEEMPELVGGLGALQRQISYPEIAKRAGVEGRVHVEFVVDEQGRVQDARVVRGPGAGLDEEALRVVRMARFTPGKQRGQPVRVRMTLPITFRLR
jgi:periplasmic protein TonB